MGSRLRGRGSPLGCPVNPRLCCWCSRPATVTLTAGDGWEDPACAKHADEYRTGYFSPASPESASQDAPGTAIGDLPDLRDPRIQASRGP